MKPNFDTKYQGIMCRVYLVRESEKSEVISICDPEDAYNLVRGEMVSSDRERFLSLMLTNKNQLIGVETVYVGSVTSIIIKPRDVFKSAILSNAAALIFCHNHPSGDLTPSEQDIVLTKHLREAGDLLGFKVLDHLIITDKGFRSILDMHSPMNGKEKRHAV